MICSDHKLRRSERDSFAPVVGTQKGDQYGVTARVINPRGEVISQASGVEEQMILAEVDVEMARREQQKQNVFGSRRTELYRPLMEARRGPR
jgi:predicted amidohydrolase